MTILHLISSSGFYGAESMLLNLVCCSRPSRQDLLAVFYNRHAPNRELFDRAVGKGARAELIDCRGRLDFRGLRQIRKFIRTSSADIVHTHGYKANFYGYVAARCEDRPVVATCHNWLAGGARLALYNRFDRYLLRRFDAVAAVSEAVSEQLISSGVRRERVRVIDNGVDISIVGQRELERAQPMSRSGQVVGIVGRLDLQKGFRVLLRAISSIRCHFPHLRLLVVGEGPDRKQIEEIVKQLGLSSLVTFAGAQVEMADVYRSIDIFVLPSLNEGMPMTILEAMAASRPIVATRVGAVPKAILHRQTGLLVEPGDEAGLAEAMKELLSDPDFSRKLGRSARTHVQKHYSAQAMAQKYRELYSDLVVGAAKGPVDEAETLARNAERYST
jgi:glycosyltransferase involved in cell wall biosynthesis